jgi:hypothetical protein
MVDSADPNGHALELARSASLATERRRTTLAAVAKPVAEVAGLLLVEVLRNPQARAAALGLARSLARWLASRRPPASAGVEVTTRRIAVVQDADTSVLVHRVERRWLCAPWEEPAPACKAMSTEGEDTLDIDHASLRRFLGESPLGACLGHELADNCGHVRSISDTRNPSSTW